jgi:hypothetical protein
VLLLDTDVDCSCLDAVICTGLGVHSVHVRVYATDQQRCYLPDLSCLDKLLMGICIRAVWLVMLDG